MRSSCVVTFLLLAAGCAPRAAAPGVTPADLATLEAERARHAGDAAGLTRVGIAFYQAGEFARARDVLAAALALDPRSVRAAVHLGLAQEGLNDRDAAEAAYRAAQALRLSGSERRLIEQRLAGLTRARLADEARRAVAAESALSATPPVPNSVAVLRFSYFGADPELRPLETGLTHLVLSDLAKVGRFTLLERERVRALSDELALSADGRADPATAARSGRLLRAATVVQGALRDDGAELRLDANVVDAGSAVVAARGSARDRLQELIAMEKSVVLQLLERMGVTLTPAERRAIEERPTADLQAFLAFSRGIEAEDRGDLGAARRAFQDAAARDPAFRAARDRAAAAARLSGAAPVTREQLARAFHPSRVVAVADALSPVDARSTQLRAGLETVAPTLAGKLQQLILFRRTDLRSRLAEALQQDDTATLGSLGEIIVIIPRL